METLRAFARNLGPVRLAVLAGVTLALAGFFVWMIARTTAAPQALLFGDLEATDAARIVSQLEAAKIPYQLGNGGTAVFVAAEQVARTRMQLAEQGLPSGGSIGYEIFDKSDALGSTNFQQNVNLVRALEGELARTIRSIGDVRSARVHLVLPRRELFSREKPEASASVLLQMRGHTRLSPGQVAAIQQLIAAAVSGLTPGRISIVDGQGTLLSDATDGADPVAGAAAKAEQRRRQLESRLVRAIEEMVERTVGPGKVRAEVTADMDFDRIDSSEEIYDPNGQVVRSTQTVDQSGSSREGAAPPVSVSTNLPDANTAAPSGESAMNSEKRSEETVNYEISKKVVNHVREAGIVKRLSAAVLVDGTWTTDAQGVRVYTPRSDAELQQLTNLVRNAVGFSAERGDKVEVVSMRFVEPETTEEPSKAMLFGLEKEDLLRIGEYVALLVLGVLSLLLVVKPIISKAIESTPMPAMGPKADLLPGSAPMQALAGPNRIGIEGPHGGSADDDAIEEMIDLERVEGRVRASSLKRVGEIVEKHPEEALAIVRSWLHAE